MAGFAGEEKTVGHGVDFYQDVTSRVRCVGGLDLHGVGAGFELDASTSGGDVRAEGLTITIAKGGVGKSRLAGSVNGGGPILKLRSSGGDISVRTE